MKLLTALILVLITSLPARAEVRLDPDVRIAIDNLNERRARYRQELRVLTTTMAATALPIIHGISLYLDEMAKVLQRRPVANNNMILTRTLLVPSAFVQGNVLYWVGSRRVPTGAPPQDYLLVPLRDQGPRLLLTIAPFLERPRDEQYEIAARDPEIAVYLVELDAWLRSTRRDGPPREAGRRPR